MKRKKGRYCYFFFFLLFGWLIRMRWRATSDKRQNVLLRCIIMWTWIFKICDVILRQFQYVSSCSLLAIFFGNCNDFCVLLFDFSIRRRMHATMIMTIMTIIIMNNIWKYVLCELSGITYAHTQSTHDVVDGFDESALPCTYCLCFGILVQRNVAKVGMWMPTAYVRFIQNSRNAYRSRLRWWPAAPNRSREKKSPLTTKYTAYILKSN